MTTTIDDQARFEEALLCTVAGLAAVWPGEASGCYDDEDQWITDERCRHLWQSAGECMRAWPDRADEIRTALLGAARDNGSLAAFGSDYIDRVIDVSFENGAPGYRDRAAWAPVNLNPWLNGLVPPATPTLGMARSDGLRLIYPGREHSILGETEAGKTWLALGCVAAELAASHHVVYIHYEEGDPASTVERLLLLGVEPAAIAQRLHFVAPDRPVPPDAVKMLCDPAPALVVHDGVNEAMSLMGLNVNGIDGASEFRRLLVTPFRAVGAATIACDHMPMNVTAGRTDAYGSVHKGNALDGTRIMLENVEPFGRAMRGVSRVLVTKDRQGYLRAHGKPTATPSKWFMGTLIVDAAGDEFGMAFAEPADTDEPQAAAGPDLATIVYDVVAAMPDQVASSQRVLLDGVREAGHKLTDAKIKSIVKNLVTDGRLICTPGTHSANSYRAVP